MGHNSFRLDNEDDEAVRNVIENEPQFENKSQFFRYAVKKALSEYHELEESG